MMKSKNLMVSFVAIVMALFFVATASALIASSEVTIDGVEVGDNPAIIAGETITIKVYFTADANASEVVIKAELDDSVAETSKFDIEDGEAYRKVLNIKVPYDFDDEDLSDGLDLEIEVKGKDTDTGNKEKEIISDVTLTVQRPSYNVDFKSINVDQNIQTGETFPVDIVLKNTGYNDIDDLYVTARIPALDVEKTAYFGELVAIEDDDDDDDTDTLSKRLYLTVPYDVATGAYTIEVEVSSDDLVLSKTVTVGISNKFPETVIKSGNDLIIVNPTDSVAGYRIVADSQASASESVVFVQAGSSETVTITSDAEGEYSFDVSVFSLDGKLVSTVTFSGEAEVNQLTNPIVILTIVLAIVFLVLLVVLIVLVTKKPQKAEEFGESYY
ncbi:hypothetical protein KAJ87_04460 [Candidatus Pacearchaeota archaeon]|nr:hypothetical protein [Candidatus Pacearchaeota archaeon]